jgi:PAS domain S-box-containing protein
VSLGGGAARGHGSGRLTVLQTAASTLDQDLHIACGIAFSSNARPMWVFDQLTLAFLAVNDAAVRAYGYSRKEFLAMTILDIRPEEDIPRLLRHTLHPHPVNEESECWRHRTKSGEILDVEIASTPLIFENRLAEVITVYRCQRAASAN